MFGFSFSFGGGIRQDFASDRRLAFGELGKEDPQNVIQRISTLVPREEVANSAEWLAQHALGDPDQDAPFLQAFGYAAIDSTSWASDPPYARPQIKIFVTEHARIGYHEWYLINVTLEQEGFERFQWEAARRHVHIKKLWYEQVKQDCGPQYKKQFAGAHFPASGKSSSIMKKLVNWCIVVARGINDGYLSPAIVALTLRFLDAPGPLIVDKRREWEQNQGLTEEILQERAQREKPSDEVWKKAMAAVKNAKKPRRKQKQAINVEIFAEHSTLNQEATTDTAAPDDPFRDVVFSVANEENKNPMPTRRVSSHDSGENTLTKLIGKRIDEHEEYEEAQAGKGGSVDQDSSTTGRGTSASDPDPFMNDIIFDERGPDTGFTAPIRGPETGISAPIQEIRDDADFAPIPYAGVDRADETERFVPR